VVLRAAAEVVFTVRMVFSVSKRAAALYVILMDVSYQSVNNTGYSNIVTMVNSYYLSSGNLLLVA